MKFKIGDHIIINELNLPGRVKRIQIEESGIIYEVRYFWNSEAKSVWFYEDELNSIPIQCHDAWHITDSSIYAKKFGGAYPRSCPTCKEMGDF